ncbi:MAG: glutamyl-tRNA reductase, partial [Bacteroidota bacterium]
MHSILKVLALSYKNTPLEIREKLAFNEEASKSFLRNLKNILGVHEAMVLSTCNRTEIYYTSQDNLSDQIAGLMKVEKGISTNIDLSNYFVSIVDSNVASRHLFRVSLGLEAQVVGDIQISNQVKNAYQWSADEEMAGPFLHRLMHAIFFSNKKVVQETAFRDGAASVSYAAVSYINELSSTLVSPKILVLGLGEIGEDVVRNLGSHGRGEVYLCNRTSEKADVLAREFDFQTIPYEEFENQLSEFDVIVSSV